MQNQSSCAAGVKLIACLAIVIFSRSALADKQEQVHDGIIVSTTADMLVMTDPDGKNEHSHKVDQATAITLDGKAVTMPELAKGDNVKVALGQDGKVVRITATRSMKK